MALRHQSRHHSPHNTRPTHLNGNGLHSPVNGHRQPQSSAGPAVSTSQQQLNQDLMHKLSQANEQTWLLIGRVSEQMADLSNAQKAYEHALRHNPSSIGALSAVAGIARIREDYAKAVEFFQRVLAIDDTNGEVWGALGHCYLMQDDLQKAYSAYQQALYLLPAPKEDPKLWYGIGILYDRYGSLDHAEDAFNMVLKMRHGQDDFDKENEIRFRLGIIYKQQNKHSKSLECFNQILQLPPSPLAHADIYFQIGHVYEQQKDYNSAKDAYERVVADNPRHAKVLQQLGWLYHQEGSSFQNQELAIQYLTKSLEADPGDAQSWYLLGRAYMAGQKYNKAYEAYQQAVYRDGRNPTFWCSIGVLYFQINQFRDALDAYSRAIRINPYISEVWYDLGSLYESCNNQISDAIDAYARASELDPHNRTIADRLQLLRNAQITGTPLPAAPGPQDVHPTAYANASLPPTTSFTGQPLRLHSPGGGAGRGRPSSNHGPPPPPPLGSMSSDRSPPHPPAPRPFRGGPPPPVVLDDTRPPANNGFAPMDVDVPQQQRSLLLDQSHSHWNAEAHSPSNSPQMDHRKTGRPTGWPSRKQVAAGGSSSRAVSPATHDRQQAAARRYDPTRHDAELADNNHPAVARSHQVWSGSDNIRKQQQNAPPEVPPTKSRRTAAAAAAAAIKEEERDTQPKKERKRRAPAPAPAAAPTPRASSSAGSRKDDHSPLASHPQLSVSSSRGGGGGGRTSAKGTPETTSARLPPPPAPHTSPPARVVDENYDEGVAETLAGLAGGYRPVPSGSVAPPSVTPPTGPTAAPTPPNGQSPPAPSINSPPLPAVRSSSLKRALSAGQESEPKRAKTGEVESTTMSTASSGHASPVNNGSNSETPAEAPPPSTTATTPAASSTLS